MNVRMGAGAVGLIHDDRPWTGAAPAIFRVSGPMIPAAGATVYSARAAAR